MARFFDVHPHDPQARSIGQIVQLLRDDALIAYPTDSGYALGCRMESHTGADRIRAIRHLTDKHHFTLVCTDFAQLGQLVRLDNAPFRAIKAATPGPYTFILPATKEVPRRLAPNPTTSRPPGARCARIRRSTSASVPGATNVRTLPAITATSKGSATPS